MKVILEQFEYFQAAEIGMKRTYDAIRFGRTPTHGAKRDWGLDIIGALGECAVAKYLKLYWFGASGIGDDDVQGVEVRTVTEASHRLIIHPTCKDDAPYVSVLYTEPFTFELRGWILGKNGKRQEWWQDPTGEGRPAYFVPNNQLLKIDLLKSPRLSYNESGIVLT